MLVKSSHSFWTSFLGDGHGQLFQLIPKHHKDRDSGFENQILFIGFLLSSRSFQSSQGKALILESRDQPPRSKNSRVVATNQPKQVSGAENHSRIGHWDLVVGE